MANNVFIGTSSTWTTTSNWSSGAAPTTGDTLFLTNSSTILNGSLNNSTVVLAGMNLAMDFTGQVGAYAASQNTYLQIVSPTATLGLPAVGSASGQGSTLFNWNCGTSSTTINILNSRNTGTGTGQAPIKLLGSALTINLVGGIISVAALATENATVNTLTTAAGGAGVSPTAYLGPGCAVGTLNLSAGQVFSYSQQATNIATISQGSAFTYQGSGSIGTLTINQGSSVTYAGSGSCNSLTLRGRIDLSGGGAAVTFGSVVMEAGAVFWDPLGRATFSATPTISGCSRDQVTLNLGINRYA